MLELESRFANAAAGIGFLFVFRSEGSGAAQPAIREMTLGHGFTTHGGDVA